uniref:Uncharacterized protein n=1 Tax=Fagus sylvatica TaxID=28930 RepID=A0A2N9FEJ3_FAGSY
MVGLPDLGVVVVNGGALDFSVEARRGGFSVDFRLGLGFCRLGFLGFAAWVSVHGVVVVDGLGLGLGSRRGGWKRVWVFGGGAVGLGLEVVEPCRIWVCGG